MSPGLAYGSLGATHHSIEDIAWLRPIANMTVIVPADPLETDQVVRAALRHDGPVYLRISRMPVPVVHCADYQFTIGRSSLLRDGSDMTLIANGAMVARALDAAALLTERGVSAAVLNMATVRPIDRDAIAAAAARGPIVTVEEHSVYGGLGSAVAEATATSSPVPMRLLGIPGVFAPTGPTAWLFEHFGLTPQGICAAAWDLLHQGVAHGRTLRSGYRPGHDEHQSATG
jgi:transketolase